MDRERHGARAMDRRYIYGLAACYHGDAIHQLNGTFGIVVLSDECRTIVWCDNHCWLRGGRGSGCGLLKVTRSGLRVVCFRHTNTFIAQQNSHCTKSTNAAYLLIFKQSYLSADWCQEYWPMYALYSLIHNVCSRHQMTQRLDINFQ